MIRVCFNDQTILKKLDRSSSLNIIRENLGAIMTDNTIQFVHNENLVRIEDEHNYKCSSIVTSNNEIYLKKVFYDQNDSTIQVLIDDMYSHQVNINKNEMLSELRKSLVSIVKAHFVFAQNKDELNVCEEEETEIQYMLYDNIINVITKNECSAAEQPQSNKYKKEISLITSQPIKLFSKEFIDRKVEKSVHLNPELEENKIDQILQQSQNNQKQNSPLSVSPNQIQLDDQSLFEEAKSMPPCSERNLQRLIFYTSLKMLGNDIQQQKEINFEILLNLEAYIEEEFKGLVACLINEQNYGTQIEESIKQCAINSKVQNWLKVYKILKNVFEEMKPLSIQILKELIGKIDIAAQLIKDQDVIILLGATGSGKSTLIQFMAGSEMENIQVNGINHIQPSKVFNKMLENVISSPFSKSETRYITPVQVEFSSVRSLNRGSVMLVDSPGFEDTNGTEVDIANSIGITKAVHNCQSVRPVILVSFLKLGDRMTGIKDLAHLLISMIPGMQEYFKRFTYVFTKFPQKEQSSLNAKLYDTIQNMSKIEKRDENFENLLFNIYNQTKHGAFFIDPINDKAGEALDKIMEVKPIKRPSEVFQTFISQKSQSIINKQVQKHQLAIYQAAKRGDYEIINYKLNELSFLIQELGQDSISQVYTKCVSYVSTNLIQNFQTATTSLNKCLEKNNNLTKEDVLLYKQFIQGSILAKVLVQNHLKEQNIPEMEAYMLLIQSKIQDFVKKIFENDILNPSVVEIFTKIQLMQEHFEEIMSPYDKILIYIEEKQKYLVAQFTQQLLEYDFKEASKNSYIFNGITAQYGLVLNQYNSQNQLENMNQALFKCLNNLTNSQQYVLIKETLTQEEIKTLRKTSCILINATSCFIYNSFNLDLIKAINENFTKQIINKFNQVQEKILMSLTKENQGSTQNIKYFVEQLESIHNIESIKFLTLEKYIQTLESLKTFITDKKREIDLIVSQIDQQYDQVNYYKLSDFFEFLQNFQWIDSYQEGIIEDNKVKIFEKITLIANNLILELMGISVDLENTQNFINASKLIKQLESILNVGKNIPQLENLINQSLQKFSNDVKKVLSEIQNLFGVYQQNKNYTFKQRKAYQSLMFLNQCSTMSFLKEIEWQQILRQVRSFIEQYGEDQQFAWKITQTRLLQFKDDQTEDKISIPVLATTLYDCCREVYQLSEKYYPVYQIYGKELDFEYTLKETYKKDLINHVENIREDMQFLFQQRQLRMLSIKLQVAKNLKIMDEFLPPTQNFVNIYKDYQDKFYDNQSEYNLEIDKSIKEYNYNEVFNGFIKLEERKYDNRDTLLRLKDILNRSLKELIDETITMANRMRSRKNIKEDKVQSIVKNLKIIQDGEKYLSDYMEPKDMLTENKNKIQEIIKKGMQEYLKYIDGLISNNNFYEAKEELTNIDLLCDILGVYCLQDVNDAIKKSNQDLDEQLINLIQHFKQMKIEKYHLDPPKEIFEKLQKGIEDNYNTTLAQIQTDLLQQLRNELSDVQKVVKNKIREQRIGKLEAVLQHLPQKIKNIIEEEIKCVKDNITNSQNERKNELIIVFESENIEEMKYKIIQYQNEGDIDTIDLIKEKIRHKIKQDTEFINDNLTKVIDSDFRHNFIKLNEYLTYIQEFLPQQYTQRILATFDNLKNKLESYFSLINSFFDKSSLIPSDQNSHKTFYKYSILSSCSNDEDDTYHAVKYVIGFINFRQQYYDLVERFPKFDKQCQQIIEKSNNTLELIQDLYNDSLQGDVLDLAKLQKFYKENSKYEGIFNIWKDNSEVLSQSKNKILIKFNRSLNQGYKISDKIEDFNKNIQSLKLQFESNCESISDQNQHLIQSERDKFFCQLNKKLQSLCDIKNIDKNFFKSPDLSNIGVQSVALLKSKIALVTNIALKTINSSDFCKQDCNIINILYGKILSFNDNVSKKLIDIEEYIIQIKQKVNTKIQQILQLIQQQENINIIAQYLMQFQAISIYLSSFKNVCRNNIQQAIQIYQKLDGNVSLVKLGQVLDQHTLGKLLISEHKVFEGFCLSLFNQKIQKHDIKYVMENIKGEEIEKVKLEKRFYEYEKKYKEIVKKYLVPNIDLNEPYCNLKIITATSRIISSSKQLQKEFYENIPEILAHISALWTLENASFYFEANGLNNQNSYLFQPHAAQIISILRIIGSGDKKEKLQNNLVQVATGEGKSIILAMGSALLAICGFDVNCACYSSYLSKRDYKLFQPFFEKLGLVNYIHYGTFDEICESYINQNGNVRNVVQNVINNKQCTKQFSNQTKRHKILLMDEVDVFFSKNFYGKYYSPVLFLQHSTITKLVTQIWQLKSEKLTLELVKALPEYDSLIQQYRNWYQLIEDSIINMIENVLNYQTPEYIIQNDKIGYKQQDHFAFNIIIGYRTMFAYFDAYQKGLVSLSSFEKNIYISVKCGQFSFAEIPSQFAYILGVSGTLEALSDSEKDVIKYQYNITKYTYTPSVFGKNIRTFDKTRDCIVENSDDYNISLQREIVSRLVGTNPETKRAVLVFFESQQNLMDFYNHHVYDLLREKTKFLTEEASEAEKQNIIQQSTFSGQITFFTKSYGRGTDIVSSDEIVKCNGGVHVIQAFLSEDYSEEVQIMGRTARQGEKGSFSMIILDKSLESIHITSKDIENNKENLYKLLNKKRNQFFNDQYQTNKEECIKNSKKNHGKSLKFLQSIADNDRKYITSFILSLSESSKVETISKTLVLLEGTVSNSALILKVKTTINLMFEQAQNILKSRHLPEDCFEIQFAIFRSYDLDIQDLLQVTGWEKSHENLRKCVSLASAKGAQGLEAVEIGLQYASKLNGVSQIILIGDAPPTKLEDIDIRRQLKGEEQWMNSQFKDKPDYIQLSNVLKFQNIKVHTYFLNVKAKTEYEEIAQITGGTSAFLDINSADGAERLTQIVAKNILSNIGQQSNLGEDLALDYMKSLK